MRVSLSEIWNFADIIRHEERGWSFTLHAGDAVVEGITKESLDLLRDDNDFNTELLPEIFTFRDILWQPDIFTEAAISLPSLRVLNSYCHEEADAYEELNSELSAIYGRLLRVIGSECQIAIELIEKADPNVKAILGTLRKNTFPIVKFFITHPRNRLDYYRDAVNRLNYAVKIIITQFNGKYTDLQDPYWEVLYNKSKMSSKEKEDALKKPKVTVEKG